MRNFFIRLIIAFLEAMGIVGIIIIMRMLITIERIIQ